MFFALIASNIYAYEIDIKADMLEYDQNRGRITAEGNVVMVWEGREVKADFAEFLIEEKILNANGNVNVTEAGNSFFANEITYSYDEESGEIKESMLYSSTIFIRAKTMQRQNGDTYKIKNVKFSNCDLNDPHTCFRASRGKIVLNKRITIYNAVLYVGKLPVFYLPIITKSLKGGDGANLGFDYSIEPGYTNDGGFSVKNTLYYRFNQSMLLKGMADYYGTRGWGYGGEFSYYAQNTKASIYAYSINDNSAGMQRWTIRPYYWQKINDEWTIQSQAELISDNSFNNYYNQNDWTRNVQTLTSYAALTRQGKGTNLMFVAQRFDRLNQYTGDFETETMSLPKVQFTYYPKKIFWGLTHNFSITYDNYYREYTTNNLFYKNTVNAIYNVTKDFRFGRKFTLKPTIGIIEDYYDKDNYGDMKHTIQTKYTGSLNSRLRVTDWMDWNINYAINLRSIPNSLTVDGQGNDYGISSHYITYTNYMYIGARTTVRNSLTYNLMRYQNDSSRKLWYPLVTEITYTPKYYITLYLRQTQELEPFEFKSLQLDLSIGNIEKAYFNMGAFYQNSPGVDNQITNTFGVGFWLTPKWRIDYNIRTVAKTDLSYSRMNEHEFKLYRDLHCYNLGVTWKIRETYHDVFFKFDAKVNMPFDRQKLEKEYREEDELFYPWR